MINLTILKNTLKKSTPFALIRFGDGEKAIINGVDCNRKGFKFTESDTRDRHFRYELIEALEDRREFEFLVGVNDEELKTRVKDIKVSASIFINENYVAFIKEIVPLFEKYPIFFVGHRKADVEALPFFVEKFYPLTESAWRDLNNLHLTILEDLEIMKVPTLVLVAGGAFSCTLIHKLWKATQKHTLLDIGSTLDPYIFGVNTRKYHERIKK